MQAPISTPRAGEAASLSHLVIEAILLIANIGERGKGYGGRRRVDLPESCSLGRLRGFEQLRSGDTAAIG